jgi:tRNA(His) 5'-end guanylyltransferase
MKSGEFAKRMKLYEGLANPPFLPGLPVCARLDGRNFHSFTRNAQRPFSEVFHRMMVNLTLDLVVQSSATVGYTQSDEISLVWLEHPFFGDDARAHKVCSTLSAMASVRLNALSYRKEAEGHYLREEESGLHWAQMPTFDCRAWVVPTIAEAANVLLWRQQDASRNSVQMAARHHFSHKACDHLNGKQLQEKLFTEAGVNWNDYPPAFKRGTFVKHAKTTRAFTAEELAALPPKHDAHKNPGLVIERRILRNTEDRIASLFFDVDSAERAEAAVVQ